MKIYGQIEKAQLENQTSDPTTTAIGYIYYKTDSDIVKVLKADGLTWLTLSSSADLTTHAALTGTSAHGAVATNTASQIVTRDGSGNFAAGVITVTNALVSGTLFQFANGASAQNVTGLSFNSASVRIADIKIQAHRLSDTTEAVALIDLTAVYRDGTGWDIIENRHGPDDTGLTFSITAGGQVQYTSTTFSGSYTLKNSYFIYNTMGIA